VVTAALFAAMQRDAKVSVLTAAMCEGNKLQKIRDTYPSRFFDVGICESHAVAFAAREDLEGRFTDTKHSNFAMALDISAYSLTAMAQRAEPLMEAYRE